MTRHFPITGVVVECRAQHLVLGWSVARRGVPERGTGDRLDDACVNAMAWPPFVAGVRPARSRWNIRKTFDRRPPSLACRSAPNGSITALLGQWRGQDHDHPIDHHLVRPDDGHVAVDASTSQASHQRQ
jgi:hypothetical protein